MAHGPDTEELLRRIANIQNGVLNIAKLNITSLPDLPPGIEKLMCHNTQLTTLPALPSGLQRLWCSHMQLTSLPALPYGLEFLWCPHTPLRSLPTLPSTLINLWCSYTQLTTLPELPSGLQKLESKYTPLILQREFGESIAHYNARWNEWRQEGESKMRCQERCSAVKEELIANVWRPDRLEKLLEISGWELVEGL